MILKKKKVNCQIRTPTIGGTLIQIQEYTSPLLNWNHVDRWLKIGEKWKRRKYITAKKTATRKVHLKLKIYEAFYGCINSMNSMSLSNIDEESSIRLIQQFSNTIKDAFIHIGGKLDELPNQIRDTVARDMM